MKAPNDRVEMLLEAIYSKVERIETIWIESLPQINPNSQRQPFPAIPGFRKSSNS